MDTLLIPPSAKTPMVRLDPAAGLFELTGVSLHENAHQFFDPVLAAVDEYASAPALRTSVQVFVTYFNSSSAKCLLDILRRFEDLHATGVSKVQVEWVHAAGDLDMAEAAQDYSGLLDLPFTVRAAEE